MNLLAKLKGYFVEGGGTWIKVFIPGVDLQENILNRNIKNLEIRFDDGRHITVEQRKKIYATVNDIVEYTGYMQEEQKEWLKYLHISRTGCNYFSLSNCSIETAKEFINTILDYCLENGIMLKEIGLERTNDIDHYLWKCLKERVCCICGKPHSDIHHIEAIGRGYDRNKYDDSEHLKACLCRNHHTESHTIGQLEFMKKYKVYGIKYKEE